MSWSVYFQKPVPKHNVDYEIDQLHLINTGSLDHAAEEQLRAAKVVAKQLATAINGPYLTVSISGHANGTGHQKKKSYANDAISVNISQITEQDLEYEKSRLATMAMPLEERFNS